MTKQMVSIRGKETRYLDYGSTDAPVVLFLHGFPESSLLWEKAALAVQATGFRAVAPDLPGFGQSEVMEEPAVWARYMEFVSDFTEALSLKEFHLVTHDWGVLIGVRWACAHPGRLRSLVISDATFSADYTWHKDASIIRTENAGEQWTAYFGSRPVFEGFLKKSIPAVDSSVIDDFHLLYADPGRSRVTLELYRSGNMEELEVYRGRLAELLPIPVTIIFGEHDAYIHPELGLKLQQEELSHAAYHVIPGAGHFTPLETPDEFNAILMLHLRRA